MRSNSDACASKLNDAAISRSKPASIASRAAAVRSARATVPYSGPTKIAARRVGAPGGVGGDAARDLALLHLPLAAVGEQIPRIASAHDPRAGHPLPRSEEHTSELQSLMRISYAVFCLKKKTTQNNRTNNTVNN